MRKLPAALFLLTILGVVYASRHPWRMEPCGGNRASLTGFSDIGVMAAGFMNVSAEKGKQPHEATDAPAPGHRDEGSIQSGAYKDDQFSEATRRQELRTFIMQAGMTFIVCLGALFVILAGRFTPADRHWAYATVGTLLGFWLHGVG